MHINTARRRFTGIDDYAHTHTQTQTHTHTHTRARAHAHTHTHTHTHIYTYTHTHTHVRAHKHYTDCWGEGQYYTDEMLREEKGHEFVFEGRETSRMSDVSGKVVPDVRIEIGERAKAMSFAVEAS